MGLIVGPNVGPGFERQWQLLFGGGAGLGGFLVGNVEQARMGDLFARQQLFDGEDLDARVFVLQGGRFVESGFGGFFQHGLGGRFHADQNADLRVFAFDDAAQVAHVGELDVSGFDGKDSLFGLAASGFVVEVEAAIDATVSPLRSNRNRSS